MPVECSHKIKSKNQAAFNAIDYEVMSQAFAIHNRLGCFLDESIYNHSLTSACIEIGFGIKISKIIIRTGNIKVFMCIINPV